MASLWKSKNWRIPAALCTILAMAVATVGCEVEVNDPPEDDVIEDVDESPIED